MAHVSVAEAKNNLSALIERALAGEHVVITRHGHEVVEIRAIEKASHAPISRAEIRRRREARPVVAVSAVDMLNAMYDEAR